MGIRLGDCQYQRFAIEGEHAVNLVTEALTRAPTLQLLVVILPGKTPFYGKHFELFHLAPLTFKIYGYMWFLTF